MLVAAGGKQDAMGKKQEGTGGNVPRELLTELEAVNTVKRAVGVSSKLDTILDVSTPKEQLASV